MRHKLYQLFEESESWPYNDYESFQDFMEQEDPSIAQVYRWLVKQYTLRGLANALKEL